MNKRTTHHYRAFGPRTRQTFVVAKHVLLWLGFGRRRRRQESSGRHAFPARRVERRVFRVVGHVKVDADVGTRCRFHTITHFDVAVYIVGKDYFFKKVDDDFNNVI